MAHRKSQKKTQYYDTPLHASQPPLSSGQFSTPVFGSVPVGSHSLGIVFRLSRPRTWAFPSIGFLLGYVMAVGWNLFQIGLGLLIASFVTAATNIVNAYADRHEDRINQPRRVSWLEQIGRKEVVASTIIFYGVSIALSLYLGLAYMIVLAVGIFNSVFYSLPPLRFKARPLASLISFSGAVGIAYLAGSSVTGRLDVTNPMLWLVTFFMFTYGTVKNLPDYRGDKKAGTKTTATVFRNLQNAVSFSIILLVSPYILLAGLVTTGLLPLTYLADFAMFPLLGFILVNMRRAKTAEALEKAHTFGFFYAISFLLFTLVLASPSLPSILTLLGVYAWTLFVSRIHVDSRIERRDWEREKASIGSRTQPTVRRAEKK